MPHLRRYFILRMAALSDDGGHEIASAVPSNPKSAPVRGDGAGHGRNAVDELGAEEHVGIVEHALLEGHYDELGVREVGLDHVPDVLRVAQVQSCINLSQQCSAASHRLRV